VPFFTKSSTILRALSTSPFATTANVAKLGGDRQRRRLAPGDLRPRPGGVGSLLRHQDSAGK